MKAIQLAEQGKIPDALIRFGIRRRLARKLRHEAAHGTVDSLEHFIQDLDNSPIAVHTDEANQQHYEVPPEYFVKVLGKRLKYSACFWPDGIQTLDAAEEAALQLVAQRADITPDTPLDILELGCGWGSFSLWAAERFPRARIHAVSNSRTQRTYIESRIAARQLQNLTVQTCDINDFAPERRFHRVVSIEMFEHMKNYRLLLRRIHSWMLPNARLFVHIFTHRLYAYPYIVTPDDWMARYFFTGGNMPSDDLLLHFPEDLAVCGHWRLNGIHYSRTLEAWLQTHDLRKNEILPIFEKTYGNPAQARIWFHRWRLFYLACSELFRYQGGQQWQVSHYAFQSR